MIRVYQECRGCGVRVPAGFTNCDGCYHRSDKAETETIRYLPMNPGIMKPVLHKGDLNR